MRRKIPKESFKEVKVTTKTCSVKMFIAQTYLFHVVARECTGTESRRRAICGNDAANKVQTVCLKKTGMNRLFTAFVKMALMKNYPAADCGKELQNSFRFLAER